MQLPTNQLTLALPSRISTALGVAITGAIAVTQELKMSHPLHQLIVIAGGLVLAFVVKPESGS